MMGQVFYRWANKQLLLEYFFFSVASNGGRNLTPILRMMRLVFYHRYNNQLVLGYILSPGASGTS
jgi:hypothetical protein